jgi:hypothetical protein
MNRPEHILRTLDRHLVRSTRIIIYGRAALALGFAETLPAFHSTMDVDAILPEFEMGSIEEDDSFWNALEITNEELEASGLYITHLFMESQVILRPQWLSLIVPIELSGLRYLELFRPSVEDLILTKMMRVDPQDREDLRFLISRSGFTRSAFDALLSQARTPPIQEIQEAFKRNSAWLLEQI